jgi:LacI family transcriptional regulator
MQTTLKDVAEKSGYSVTTVSRALAGYHDVNEQTREHIVSVAQALGYQPNLVARQLRSQRTNTIGMIIPTQLRGSEDDFFSVLMKGVSYTAARHQYDILLSAQPSDVDELEAYRRIVGGNRVDGVILARTHLNDPRIAYLKEINHPFVVAGRLAPDQVSDFPHIDMDSQAGIRMLVEHFVDYGHRNIGLILPPEDIAYTPYRFAGYRKGLVRAGIEMQSDHVLIGDLTRAGGYRATKMLLRQAPELSAIIACNDLMAFGAMQAAQEQDLIVGEDIAIGGFDDIPISEHATPSLTTIRQPIYEIGENLTEMLLKIIAHEPLDQVNILLKPHLVVRDSSGQPRH